MPLFEYQCPSCTTRFELLVRGGARPRCPDCGSPDITKLLSVPARPATAPAGAGPESCATPGPAGGCCGGGACGLN